MTVAPRGTRVSPAGPVAMITPSRTTTVWPASKASDVIGSTFTLVNAVRPGTGSGAGPPAAQPVTVATTPSAATTPAPAFNPIGTLFIPVIPVPLRLHGAQFPPSGPLTLPQT